MKDNAWWARVALLANLVGTVLLFLSFQATSSDFRLVTTQDKRYALCIKDDAVLIKNGETMTMGAAVEKCPEWENSKPAAVVNVEKPSLVTAGFILSMIGFFMQFYAIPKRKTVPELNEEIRRLQKEKKIAEIDGQNSN